jgi:CubicO group peptidase (beta-lactamase class C family)
MSDTPLDALYREHQVLAPGTNLEKMADRLARVPLLHQPGSRFTYGLSVDVLARVVEVVSKKKLDEFFREQIFEPLDMKDTAFYVPKGKQGRLAASHGRNKEGKLIVTEAPAKSPFLNEAAPPFGGHGLVSTARDYARFCQMLLNGGQLDGKRILREETVRLMTQNQLPPEAMPVSVGPQRREGVGFGLGFSVRVAANTAEAGSRVGEYGWGGAASTHFWISPRDDLFVVALQQFQPFTMLLEENLKPLVYDAIIDEPKK